MMKKVLFVIFSCLVLIMVGFLCLNNFKSGQDRQVVIQFASWGSESEIKILKPLLENFEKENPNIKIDFLHIPQNYFQKIHLLIASNTAPDVIFMNNQYLPIYANAGVLEDLSQYDKDFQLDKFFESSIKALTYDKKIYAIPRDISTLVIFYNKDIFDKYGVNYPKENWSYDEFLKTAKKLTHRPNLYGISFEEEPIFYLPYLMSFGLEKIPEYDDLSTQKGLKLYAELRNKYHVAPLKTESASATMAQMFLQGKLAMHLTGRWLVPKYRQDAKFRWDVVTFPVGASGSIAPADVSGWAVSKNSKHKKEAIMLIQYLSSEKSAEKFAQSGLVVPARIDAAYSKAFLDGKSPKNAQVFIDSVLTSVPTPVSVDYKEKMDLLKKKTEVLFNK